MKKNFGVICGSVGLGGTENDVELFNLVPNVGTDFLFVLLFFGVVVP